MEQKEIVKIKYDLRWYIVQAYLRGLEDICIFSLDKKLDKMLKEAKKYVEEKLTTDYKGEITDSYAVVEQYKN